MISNNELVNQVANAAAVVERAKEGEKWPVAVFSVKYCKLFFNSATNAQIS